MDRALKVFILYLVKQQSQDNGCGEAEDKIVDAKQEGIDKQPGKIGTLKKTDKVLKPDPFASQYSFGRIVVLKGDQRAVHRLKMKQNIIKEYQRHQQIQAVIALHILFETVGEGGFCKLSLATDHILRPFHTLYSAARVPVQSTAGGVRSVPQLLLHIPTLWSVHPPGGILRRLCLSGIVPLFMGTVFCAGLAVVEAHNSRFLDGNRIADAHVLNDLDIGVKVFQRLGTEYKL